MVKEGIIEEGVSPLMNQLARAKSVAGEDAPSPQINALFDDIEGKARYMKDVFRRVDRWEEEVIHKFGSIAGHISDMSEEEGDNFATLPRLQSIDLEMSDLRDYVTPALQLPLIESNTATLPEAPQAYEDRRRFVLERQILGSSAMSNFKVSYKNLEFKLKQCLLCFSIFPENVIIKKTTLIHWWIGEGLVTPTTDRTAEENGDCCFKNLIEERLIEPIYSKWTGVINCCKIHPVFRRELISDAKRKQFFNFDSQGSLISDFPRSGRACLVTSEGGGASSQQRRWSTSDTEELLMLFNVNEQYLKFDKSWFSKMKKVAVLQLGRWQTLPTHHIEVENTKFLEWLRYFKHLKYLSLRGISYITHLPASIGELTNLMILDLQACHHLERLTVGITSLTKLTHLDVSECHFLYDMPKGIGSLVELRVLKGFLIDDSGSRLSELAKLKKLRKLSVNIGSRTTVRPEELNALTGLTALRSLTITWGAVESPSEITTSLDLPPHLAKLDILCFPDTMVPNWLNPRRLSNLKKLYIRGGSLESLGLEISTETWNVEVLHLKFLSKLEVGRAELQEGFPAWITWRSSNVTIFVMKGGTRIEMRRG